MSVKKLAEILSKQGFKEVNAWIAKYPADFKCSAVMAALRIVQDEHGYLTLELLDIVADYLEMQPISVYEVATFYSMYDLKPVGKIKICVCTNISCMLCGSDQIVAHLEKKLNIRMGQTTADKMFTLKEVECLGACCGAPAIHIGKRYHENLTLEKLDKILAEIKAEVKGSNMLEDALT